MREVFGSAKGGPQSKNLGRGVGGGMGVAGSSRHKKSFLLLVEA